MSQEQRRPSAEVVQQAKQHPNGWVYEIDGEFGEDEDVPPEAIIGAWEVDGEGNLTGKYLKNSGYRPNRVRS